MRRWLVAALVASLGLAPVAMPTAAAGDPDTVGAVDTAAGRWHLRTELGRTVSFTYGNPGDVPFTGDWDCDGVDTPGLYRPSDGFVYLRNSISTGIADVEFFFGDPGDVPLAGDFDADGCDTVSLYRPRQARVYVVNRIGHGAEGLGVADFSFPLGDPGDQPFVADADGDGIDEVGLHRAAAGRVYLRFDLAAGVADRAYHFGDPDDVVLAGDWDGDGVATASVYRPRRRSFHLTDEAGPGVAVAEFHFGGRGHVPIAGAFGLGDAGEDVDWTPRKLTIAMTGDILIHTSLWRAAGRGLPAGAYDFGPMFAPLRPVLDTADLSLCHLEVTLSRDNTVLSSYPRFTAPREVAAGIAAAGYDGCSVASNHAWDRGRAGVVDTLDALESAGLGHAGTARSAAEAERTTFYAAGPATVAHLSYTKWLNGLRLPAGEAWWVDLIDPVEVAADARRARQAGANLVVVSLHWGSEYQTTPTPYQLDIAEALAAIPEVDVLVGHHAHVVQPVGVVQHKYVVYGLGNSASGQTGPLRQDGAVALLDASYDGTGWAVEGVRMEPTWFDRGTFRVLPAAPTVAAGAPPALAELLRASYGRTMATMQLLGAAGVEAATTLG